MDSITKRVLLSAGIGLGVAVSGVSLYLLLKDTDDGVQYHRKQVSTTQSVVSLKVPKEAIGVIIGRGGEQIKKIQTETKTRINFEDNHSNGNNICNQTVSTTRTVFIKGSAENVAKAENIINQMIADQSVITTKKFLIPTSAVGIVIGRNGDNIRYMCEKSGAKINVKSQKNWDKKELFTPISMTGSPEQLEEAQKLIDIEIEKNENFLKSRSNYSNQGKGNTSLLAINEGSDDYDIDYDNYYEKLISNNKNEMIEVFVSAVKSPNHFYVQYTGSKGIQLDHFMDRTTDFYELESNRQKFKPESIKVGDIMAAPYPLDEHWYRVKITSVEDSPYSLQDSMVGVFYLDYGDEAQVKYSQICSLKDDLLRQLPFQAIECSLSSVVSKYQIDWSESAIETFRELTHSALWKSLSAKLVDVRKSGKKDRYFIELFDMNSKSTDNNTGSHSDVDDWDQSSTVRPLDIGKELIRSGFGVSTESDSAQSLI